jgi:2-methylisocitrate lyase-like PEP mutase family enzyme
MKNKFDPALQNKLAEKIHALHHADEMLVLPNAWDCISAKIFEAGGFPAIATTSSGISWSCGYPDGEHIPPRLMLEVINRIAHSVTVPLTADIEGGYYRDDWNKFSEFIGDVIEAGAVGVNLEDSDSKTGILNDVKHQAKAIKLIKECGKQKSVNLFVNARTDAMGLAKDLKTKIQICIERAKSFEEAGADGIFIPFVKEMETVAQLKEAIRLPLNILITDTLDIGELKKLKVNRVSVGSKAVLATMNLIGKIAEELKNGNDWHSLFVKEPTYGEVNGWFE